MSILILCIIATLILFLIVFTFNVFDYYISSKRTMKDAKYISLSYKKAVTLDKIGIDIFDSWGLFYFEKKNEGGYVTERIYILFSYIDFLRFKSYKKKKKKRKEKNEIKKNESKEGYEYLLNELKKYADDCQGKADECFSESKRILNK